MTRETVKTIVDIKAFLQQRERGLSDQFAIDWVEETINHMEDILDSEGITVDDDTFCASLRYNVGNVIEIVRPDAPCFQFYVDLQKFLNGEIL